MPVRPSQKEEEYVAKMEMEKKKRMRLELLKTLAEEEKTRLRNLHYMRCPKCGMELRETDYRGIKVDRCSACDGVWLDAGEIDALEKLDRPSLDKLFSVFKR
jgi:hypothetical protein